MPKAPFVDSLGQKGKEVDLPPEVFDVQVNVPILNEVIKAQLASARSGTHSTKTRAEVRGGGAKPWRQKGTGRARHGSIREPQWVGGGIAHGPKPRDYSSRINKKERQLALKSALTDRAREGKLLVIEFPDFEEPETKKAVDLLKEWDVTGRTLIVVSPKDEESQKRAWLSFRNLPHVLTVTYPTAYTVLAADTVIFTKSALDELVASKVSSKESDSKKTSAAPAPSSAPDRASSTKPGPSEAQAKIFAGNYKEITQYKQVSDGSWTAQFPFSSEEVQGTSKEEVYENLLKQHKEALRDSEEYKQTFLAWVMANDPQISQEEYEKKMEQSSELSGSLMKDSPEKTPSVPESLAEGQTQASATDEESVATAESAAEEQSRVSSTEESSVFAESADERPAPMSEGEDVGGKDQQALRTEQSADMEPESGAGPEDAGQRGSE